jgi:hypothetical protein
MLLTASGETRWQPAVIYLTLSHRSATAICSSDDSERKAGQCSRPERAELVRGFQRE